MIVTIEPGKGPDGNLEIGTGSPEKGFRIVSTRGNPTTGDQTVGEARVLPDRDAVPDGGSLQGSATADSGISQDAVRGFEPAGLHATENARPRVEGASSGRERSPSRERFERRAEEIARAAEIGVRTMMKDEADLLPPVVEDRLPEVPDQRRLPGGDARQEAIGQNADAGVQEGTWSVDPESRDSVPFGLKRRVQIRTPILGDEERRSTPRVVVSGDQAVEVRVDARIGVDHDKVAAVEKGCGVPKRPGGAQNHGLFEKRELRKLRRITAEVALDLIAQVMEVHRYFADAGLAKAAEMRAGQRDVQKR
jgi:hypothetical protein